MTEDEFLAGLDDLCLYFEKRTKSELSHRIYQRLAGHDKRDWQSAVEHLIEEPDRRTMPRFGEMKKAVIEAAGRRYQAAVNDRRDREWHQAESISDIILHLPFPHDLKSALERKMQGEISQVELEEFCDNWTAENVPPKSCLCDDGLVHYKKPGPDGKPYTHVAACGLCDTGRAQPKAYTRVDPETLRIMVGA